MGNRVLLVTILAHHGHELLQAADGREGLALAQAEHPDLVITDVLMPLMDGYELVRQLTLEQSTRDIPVIFCTAHYGAREARALALAGGVFDVLTKPVESKTLLQIVERALSGRCAAGQTREAPLGSTFDREHLRLVTNKLSDTADDLRSANARLRAVINIGLDFASEQDSDRLLAMVCEACRDLFAATYVILGIVDRSGDIIQRLATCGVDAGHGLKVGDAVTGMLHAVVAGRRTQRGDHSGGDPAAPPFHAEVQAFLIAPIASAAHVHGWIALVGNDGHGFTEEDERLLVALGGQVGRTYEVGHLSQHDFLTDLPNRMLLTDRVTHAMALARRDNHRVAVLFLDLDRFKRVNDSFGHLAGDRLLQSVAQRLVSSLRSSDTVSRHGGDEFVVLLSRIEHADEAATAARTVIAALRPPHDIEHQQVHLTATIGISIYPDDSIDGETLIRCADLAMYQAKANDRQPYRFFEPAMNARALERQGIEAGLHLALERREFVLHYQPRIDLGTGELAGAEALIRWMHPERGVVFPADFVPVAEDCGLMVLIGRWVLAEACRQARSWTDEGRQPILMAVNISAVELRDPHFLEHVGAVLHDSRLDARRLELELTESSLMQHVPSTVLVLQALENLGVQLAIDDFGTGYSSLSYLRQFPIAALKIDQSFVRGITADPVDTAIVRAVIGLGKSLGHRVVAEGVETHEELAFLKAQQCDEGQGYYFGRPLAADEFGALLRR
jgi:diguanylate cyclase (GGDEF)-like protein